MMVNEINEIFAAQSTTPDGLSEEEAFSRLQKCGKNELKARPPPSIFTKIWLQVKNILIAILIVTAIVSGVMRDWAELVLIIIVIVINIAIGVVQEGRAEKAAGALTRLLAPTASVKRNGIRKEVNANEVVQGDIIFIKSGDRVPADARLISASNLHVMEAMLTGESVAVSKDTIAVPDNVPLGDRKCMVFSATMVTSGQGEAVVVGTGQSTEIGKISTLVNEVETAKTNLLVQLEIFGRWISALVLVVGLTTLLVAYFARGVPLGESFQAAVTIAVATIPEGLPAVVTICLAIGVQAMAQKHAVVRQLPAVETLGTVTVICSDKTGTLTKNEMTAVRVLSADKLYKVIGTGYSPDGGAIQEADGTNVIETERQYLSKLLTTGILCNDSSLTSTNPGWATEGEPTELALLTLGVKVGISTISPRNRVAAIPFESHHKFMATFHENEGKVGHRVCIKGAPDRLLPLCGFQAQPDSGQAVTVNLPYWTQNVDNLSAEGLRVLCLAEMLTNKMPSDSELKPDFILNAKGQLVVMALVGILDPPREEVGPAIAEAVRAGIVTKMITGDHPLTAIAIGRAIGIKSPYALTGVEVDKMSEDTLQSKVFECNIFARTSPENKLQIVRALQARGAVCAMTGDGVNDAPALKAAEVGVAMGITGTDVSREAAKMVLADDNFATIINAVKEGRRIWDNLRKIMIFNMPVNIAQGFIIFFAYMIPSIPASPLTPIQILYVNIATGVTLGLAFACEPPEPGVMLRPPRRVTKPLLGKKIIWRMVFMAAQVVACIVVMFRYNVIANGLPAARAEAFATLVLCEMTYAFNCRFIHKSSIHLRVFRGNNIFFLCVLITAILLVIPIHTPVINTFFGGTSMDGIMWGRSIAFAVGLFFVIEIEKQLAPPLVRALRRTPCMSCLGGLVPCSLSFSDKSPHEQQSIRFIATSPGTFGIPLLQRPVSTTRNAHQPSTSIKAVQTVHVRVYPVDGVKEEESAHLVST